jgi:hypothetical protein
MQEMSFLEFHNKGLPKDGSPVRVTDTDETVYVVERISGSVVWQREDEYLDRRRMELDDEILEDIRRSDDDSFYEMLYPENESESA